MNAPVSVIIPTYNRCESVCVAIASALQQTLAPAEVIVVDDGSSDSTASVVREKFPAVKLIEQDNNGVSHARNQGIQIATQPWIAFLDSDDQWFDNKLVVQLSAIDNEPVHKICHCDEHWIRNGKRVNPMNKHQKRGGFIYEHCLPLCAISPSAVLIHESLFAEVGLFDESLPACEDYDLWLRICAKYPALYIDEFLLAKTGGHEDQLSRKHWGMDRFRLQALAKIMRTGTLTTEQHEQTLQVFKEKFTILQQGAVKRDNQALAGQLDALYADLM